MKKLALINIFGLLLSCIFLLYIMIFGPSTIIPYNEIILKNIEKTTQFTDLQQISLTILKRLEIAKEKLLGFFTILIIFNNNNLFNKSFSYISYEKNVSKINI